MIVDIVSSVFLILGYVAWNATRIFNEQIVETIEAGGGLWLSTSESAWHPAGYVSRTGDRIWG